MSPTTRNIKAFVFDAYGTLFDVSSVRERCDHFFPGKGAQIAEIWRVKQLEYTWLGSLMARYRSFWEITQAGLRFACTDLGLDLTSEIQDDLMQHYHQLAIYPEVATALETLAARFPLAILSNGTMDMLRNATRNSKIDGHFKEIYSVEDLAIFKPSPRVYSLVVDGLDIPAKQIGFISSNAWDAAGAKSFGLHVFWINRFKRTAEELGFPPDHTIQTLDDIVELMN